MVKYKFEDIAFNSTLKKKPVEEDKYTYIGLEHLDSGSLTVNRYGSDVAPKGEKLLMKKGDVLFGKRRAYQKKVAIAPFDGIFSAHGMVLRPKENVIDKNFFPLFISSDYFLEPAIKISVGSLSPTINWGDLKQLEFELPSLEDQRKLAKILWAAEETKQAYKNLLQKTDDLVKAKFEEVSHDIKNADCERKQWMDVVNITNGKDHKKISGDGPYAVYGTGGKMMAAKEYMCDKGTIIMGRKGTIDKPYIASEKCWIVDTAFGVNPKNPNILNPIYLYQYIKQIDYSKLNKACTLPSTTKSDLLKLWIDVPSTKVQNTFVQFAQQAEQSKQQLQTSLDSLNVTMRALINENLK